VKASREEMTLRYPMRRHGTDSMYVAGCRCSDCRVPHAAAAKARHHRLRGEGLKVRPGRPKEEPIKDEDAGTVDRLLRLTEVKKRSEMTK